MLFFWAGPCFICTVCSISKPTLMPMEEYYKYGVHASDNMTSLGWMLFHSQTTQHSQCAGKGSNHPQYQKGHGAWIGVGDKWPLAHFQPPYSRCPRSNHPHLYLHLNLKYTLVRFRDYILCRCDTIAVLKVKNNNWLCEYFRIEKHSTHWLGLKEKNRLIFFLFCMLNGCCIS